jgi:hypothetical protein
VVGVIIGVGACHGAPELARRAASDWSNKSMGSVREPFQADGAWRGTKTIHRVLLTRRSVSHFMPFVNFQAEDWDCGLPELA